MIIGITGRRRHGKDSVAKVLSNKGFTIIELPAPLTEELCIINPWCEVTDRGARANFPRFVRFADLVKEVGIDMAKDISPDVRPYQQRYGTDIVRDRIDEDRWVKLALAKMDNPWGRYVLPNIRVDNEAALCDRIIRVVRPGYDESVDGNTHKIEDRIDTLPVDATILNDGSLEDLRKKVTALMEEWGC